MSAKYDYSQGNLLEERNTYFYTRYQGREFLHAWRESRSEALAALPSPIPAPSVPTGTRQGRKTGQILDSIMSDLQAGRAHSQELLHLVQRFEVTKRVHGEYGDDWRAVDRGDYRDMGLYVRFAETAEHAYAGSGNLPFLNVLLKVIDTLVALRTELSDDEAARLATLILAERRHIDTLEGKIA